TEEGILLFKSKNSYSPQGHGVSVLSLKAYSPQRHSQLFGWHAYQAFDFLQKRFSLCPCVSVVK
ncbi:MAG: hypothetical protein PVG12_12280, partial [Gammaproteobacteria bacterium]